MIATMEGDVTNGNKVMLRFLDNEFNMTLYLEAIV